MIYVYMYMYICAVKHILKKFIMNYASTIAHTQYSAECDLHTSPLFGLTPFHSGCSVSHVLSYIHSVPVPVIHNPWFIIQLLVIHNPVQYAIAA